ncbi:hypothetical protein ACJMK2_025793 [Sinanodonta woodiana]|uniref:Dixin n=1 Tax=Sinanodonta woodiana TaxID=1069815 RepID=A0ABD3XJH1_SINWO
MSASPVKSPDSEESGGSQSWVEWSNQLQAYMAWINSQLKKKQGAHLVEDLRNDTRDGVAFIELIEVIAGERLPDIHTVPTNYTEMKENVERVLHFMNAKKIRMHHINAKDIVDGNLKSTMRLLLALAAHFKPKSVKHSGQVSRSGGHSPNMTGIAQGASAALAKARRTVAKAGSSFRRHKGESYKGDRRKFYHESSSDQCSDSDPSFLSNKNQSFHSQPREEVEGASCDSSSIGSSIHSPQSTITMTSTPKSIDSASRLTSTEHISSKDSGTELEDSAGNPLSVDVIDKAQYDTLLEEYAALAQSMVEIKKELVRLQDLLLSGQPPDGEEASSPDDLLDGATKDEQNVVLKSYLQQAREECYMLKEELSRSKLENIQSSGIKNGLQQRLSEQDGTISELKAKLLRRDFDVQTLDSERANFQKQLQDKEKMIVDLRRDLLRRDQNIDHLKNELRNQIQEKECTIRNLKAQISDLHTRFRVVGETGASLSARVATQDKKMAQLAGKILQTRPDSTNGMKDLPRVPPVGSDDLSVIRDSLYNLRTSFPSSDPRQHTIDTLEQGFSTLMDRISHTSVLSSHDHAISRRLNFDSTGDFRRSPITAIPGSPNPSFSVANLESSPVTDQETTKVLYFTEKSTTPAMCTICKRLGKITLSDFKQLHDKPGAYRYHFKALDPEFGTVKEEITDDDAVIPGWEGKIVAWIEEDTGQ